MSEAMFQLKPLNQSSNASTQNSSQVFTQIQFRPVFCAKLRLVKKDTKLNQVFCLIKISEIIFIFLPGFYLIIWLMTSPKNFEKIPILKT